MKKEFKNNYLELLKIYTNNVLYITALSGIARFELCKQRALYEQKAADDAFLQELFLSDKWPTEWGIRLLDEEMIKYHWPKVVEDFEKMKSKKLIK